MPCWSEHGRVFESHPCSRCSQPICSNCRNPRAWRRVLETVDPFHHKYSKNRTPLRHVMNTRKQDLSNMHLMYDSHFLRAFGRRQICYCRRCEEKLRDTPACSCKDRLCMHCMKEVTAIYRIRLIYKSCANRAREPPCSSGPLRQHITRWYCDWCAGRANAPYISM
jgi:hypothetical protein